MAGNNHSIRGMSYSLGKRPGDAFSVREILGQDRARLRLRARPFSFSILTYNMALLVAPASYNGTDRSGALAELIARVNAVRPDIVGLCEVFADGERDYIRAQLAAVYPYYREGPDEADLESDGGLLLLSKWPIRTSHSSIFRQCAGNDCYANKGVIFLSVQPTGSPTPCNIFFSHTQDIEQPGGESALYAQLTHIGHMVQAFADPATPTLIMGDLNIPAEVDTNYDQLRQRLGLPVDLWLIDHPRGSGTTFEVDNNFYDDSDDAPSHNSRLDYIFLRPGSDFVPLLKVIEIHKWAHNGQQISDHYGLQATFDGLIEIDAEITLPIMAVSAVIRGFRCIETTSGAGADEVSFSIALQDAHGRFVKTDSPIIGDVDTGDAHPIASMPPATLSGDPGAHVDVTVEGTEHDTISNSTMGIMTLRLSRQELLLAHGRGIRRGFPYLTAAGGEYGIECEIRVM